MKDDSGVVPEADGLALRVSRIQALRVYPREPQYPLNKEYTFNYRGLNIMI